MAEVLMDYKEGTEVAQKAIIISIDDMSDFGNLDDGEEEYEDEEYDEEYDDEEYEEEYEDDEYEVEEHEHVMQDISETSGGS
jgi:hypothetical protein